MSTVYSFYAACRVSALASCPISYHIISYHIISYHIISYHIISYHIISYHIISYHIISYHIISYHIISYHIISYHIIYQSSLQSALLLVRPFPVSNHRIYSLLTPVRKRNQFRSSSSGSLLHLLFRTCFLLVLDQLENIAKFRRH